jgi:hypothetical protein
MKWIEFCVEYSKKSFSFNWSCHIRLCKLIRFRSHLWIFFNFAWFSYLVWSKFKAAFCWWKVMLLCVLNGYRSKNKSLRVNELKSLIGNWWFICYWDFLIIKFFDDLQFNLTNPNFARNYDWNRVKKSFFGELENSGFTVKYV